MNEEKIKHPKDNDASVVTLDSCQDADQASAQSRNNDDMSKYGPTFERIGKFFQKCGDKVVYLTEDNHKSIFPCLDFLQSKLGLEAVYIDLNYRPFVQYADFIAIVAFQDIFPERMSKFEKSSNLNSIRLFEDDNYIHSIVDDLKILDINMLPYDFNS